MRRYILYPGFAALVITVICFVIMAVGPQDYEFGPAWIEWWIPVATPFAYLLKFFHAESIFSIFPNPLKWIIGLSLTGLINFIIAGILGFSVYLLKRAFLKAEQDAAANP